MFKFEPSVIPEPGFVSLDEFCQEPTFDEGQVILFNNDDDFLAFCVAPVAVIVFDKEGKACPIGQYTELYQKCLMAGMKFGIRDKDSSVNKHKVADTHVSFPEGFNQRGKDVFVHLPVQGIKNLPLWYFFFDGKVYSSKGALATIVYELVYHQGKTADDVRMVLGRYCEVLTEEQFEALNQDERDSYKVFSIKQVKYPYKGLSGKDLLSLAAEIGLNIENLVISKKR